MKNKINRHKAFKRAAQALGFYRDADGNLVDEYWFETIGELFIAGPVKDRKKIQRNRLVRNQGVELELADLSQLEDFFIFIEVSGETYAFARDEVGEEFYLDVNSVTPNHKELLEHFDLWRDRWGTDPKGTVLKCYTEESLQAAYDKIEWIVDDEDDDEEIDLFA